MRSVDCSLLIVLFLSASAAGQNWDVVKSPTEETITGICAVHPDTLFLVTADGMMARTYDGCRTWEMRPVAPTVQLEDISFTDATHGLACGRSGAVFVTDDGGESWESRPPGDTVPWYLDVEMMDAKHGLVIGMSRDSVAPYTGLLYRTTDGGKSWTKMPPLGLGYAELAPLPDGSVLLLAIGRIHRSDDLGATWESSPTVEGESARTISVIGRTGVLAGPNGMFAISSDSGKTWQSLGRPSNKLYIAAQLVSETEGYVGGLNATMMRTTDAGKTWNAELLARSFNVLDMCLTGDRLYAVGSDGAIVARSLE